MAKMWKNSPFANYTNSPQWFLSVIESFKYKDFAIIALYDKELLVAIAALVKEKKYGVSCYTVAPQDFACGIPFLFDFTNRKLGKIFAENLLTLGNIFLGNISEKFLNEFGQVTKSIATAPYSLNYQFTFEKDNDGSVLIRNRKKLLHEARNVTERLQFKTFAGEIEGLETIFAIDVKSRKQTRGYSTFSNKEIKSFYRTLATHFKKTFLVGILYLDSEPIAYGMGFLIGSSFFYNQMAYLANFRQYSPGKVLMVKLIDYLGTKNTQMFDFGSGDSFIKKLVTSDVNALYQVIMTKNKLVMMYLLFMCTIRKKAYAQLSKNVTYYKFYRSIKNIFTS